MRTVDGLDLSILAELYKDGGKTLVSIAESYKGKASKESTIRSRLNKMVKGDASNNYEPLIQRFTGLFDINALNISGIGIYELEIGGYFVETDTSSAVDRIIRQLRNLPSVGIIGKTRIKQTQRGKRGGTQCIILIVFFAEAYLKQFTNMRDIQKRAESDFDQAAGFGSKTPQDNSTLFQFDVEEEPIEEEEENYGLVSLGDTLKNYFQTNYVGIQSIRHFLIDLNNDHNGIEHLQINLKNYLDYLPNGTKIGINEKITIDKIFKTLMVALQMNGRLSLSKLSEQVNITDRALDYRKKQLISSKALNRFSLMVNASQLNLEYVATLKVTFAQAQGFISLEDNLVKQMNTLGRDDRVTAIGISPNKSLIIIGFFNERADILDLVTEIENIPSVEKVENFHFSDFAKGKEFLLPNLNYLLAEK
ncbi:MAG: hypothetical protein ACTSYA_11845 [Candidatus Kariarchaeaceae archaeon]